MATAICLSTGPTETIQQIKMFEDVIPFAGHVVALISSSPYFGNKDSSYQFPDALHCFAYVDSSCIWKELGFKLYELIKQDQTNPKNMYVCQEMLEKFGPLSVRLATPDELRRIREVISSNLARFVDDSFNHQVTEETKAILQKV